MIRKILILFTTLVLSEFTFLCAFANIYTDVPSTHWAYSGVNGCTDRGILLPSGSGDCFYPNNTLTRAQFVKNLSILMNARISNNNLNTGFSDVPYGSYYAGVVRWAVDKGVTSGTSGTTFSPNALITKEQACLMLANCYTSYDIGVCFQNLRSYTNFSDESNISSWALSAVKALYRAKVVTGDTSNNFNPKSYLTKAVAATMIYALYSDFFYLEVSPVRQRTNYNWCWAACVEMIGKYEYLNCTKNQTDIVTYIYGSPVNKPANVVQITNSLNYATNYTILHYYIRNCLSKSELYNKILSYKPVCFLGRNSVNSSALGHTVTIMGFEKTKNIIYFINPLTGRICITTYNNLITGEVDNFDYIWDASVYS